MIKNTVAISCIMHYALRITHYAWGLLLVRLVLLLFAARPSNPVVAAVVWTTAPLVWPFGTLDRWAHQPQFGARLELATLAALIVVGLVSAGLARRWRGAVYG